MAKKKLHGGKREGAGRKVGPDGPAVIVAASIPALAEQLDGYAREHGWSRSEAVARAIRGLLASPSSAAKKLTSK